MIAETQLLTPKEAAGCFRRSTATIYRWIDKGILKAACPSGNYLIPKSEIDRLLRARRATDER